MANSPKLSEETNKFLEELLATGAFHCDVCHKLMIPAAWLSADKRSFCTACCEKQKASDPSAVFIENPALNKILRKLTLPCQNLQRGCKKVLEYTAYEDHVCTCPFASSKCLYTTCTWEGAVTNLEEHFKKEHSEVAPKEHNWTFTISGKKHDVDKIYLLQTVNGCFFLTVQWADVCVKMRLFHHYVVQEVKASFYYRLTPSPGEKFQRRCEFIDQLPALHSGKDSSITSLNVHAMPETFPIEIVYNLADNYSLVPECILPCYVCWDCKQYIKTDVLCCPNDHQMCKNCLDTTGHNCTSGRYTTGSQSIRSNKVLNLLAKEYLLPCRYQRFGCRYHVPLTNDHEHTCRHKHLRCPLKGDCLTFFKDGEFTKHLRSVHCGVELFEGIQLMTYRPGKCNANTSIIVADGEFFRISCTGECVYHGYKTYRYIEWTVEQLAEKKSKEWVFSVRVWTIPFKKAFSTTHLCGEVCQLKTTELPECHPAEQILFGIEVTRLNESVKSE